MQCFAGVLAAGLADVVMWAADSGHVHLFAVSGGPRAHRHVPAFVLPSWGSVGTAPPPTLSHDRSTHALCFAARRACGARRRITESNSQADAEDRAGRRAADSDAAGAKDTPVIEPCVRICRYKQDFFDGRVCIGKRTHTPILQEASTRTHFLNLLVEARLFDGQVEASVHLEYRWHVVGIVGSSSTNYYLN